METIQAIQNRRSCRFFNSRPVPRALVEKIIDCGRLAPTARNVQPWEFVVVTKKETLKTLGSLAENAKFLADCALCIAVFCQDTKYYLEDGAAATMNILTAASDLGVAACWVAGDKKDYCEEVKKMLGAPTNYKLVSMVALGYSDSKPGMPFKKPLKEVLHWEKF